MNLRQISRKNPKKLSTKKCRSARSQHGTDLSYCARIHTIYFARNTGVPVCTNDLHTLGLLVAQAFTFLSCEQDMISSSLKKDQSIP